MNRYWTMALSLTLNIIYKPTNQVHQDILDHFSMALKTTTNKFKPRYSKEEQKVYLTKGYIHLLFFLWISVWPFCEVPTSQNGQTHSKQFVLSVWPFCGVGAERAKTLLGINDDSFFGKIVDSFFERDLNDLLKLMNIKNNEHLPADGRSVFDSQYSGCTQFFVALTFPLI